MESSCTSCLSCLFFLIFVVFIINLLISKSSKKSGRSKKNAGASSKTSGRVRMEPVKWLGTGNSFKIKDYLVIDQLVYWSDSSNHIPEASCIDLKLPVSNPGTITSELGYWPEYSRMSPAQRANYLLWLTGGCKSPLSDIGYAFVYFYGLERRALVDGKDLDTITLETLRLLRTYASSASFNSYLRAFLLFITVKNRFESIDETELIYLLGDGLTGLGEEAFRVLLAWFYNNKRPVSADYALEIAGRDLRSPRSVVTERAREQFQKLFAMKYAARFPQGMFLKAAVREYTIEYRPASPSLLKLTRSGDLSCSLSITNVLGIQSQFKPLVEIWGQCIEELRAYSREIAKGPGSDEAAVYRALPEALKAERDHPDKLIWADLAASNINEEGYACLKISALPGIADKPALDAKLTLSRSRELALTANEVGFLIVPDPRVTGRVYAHGDTVALLKPRKDAFLPENPAYSSALFLLELGTVIAAADGEIDHMEIANITGFLETLLNLSLDERRLLKAYRSLLEAKPPSLSGLSKRLKSSLTPPQLEIVGRYLVGIAAANGVITTEELAAIRRIYRYLDLDPSTLDGLLLDLGGKSGSAVEIQTGKRASREDGKFPAVQEGPVVLNDDLLRKILAETAEVSNMLGEVLKASEDEESPQSGSPVSINSTGPSSTAGVEAVLDTQEVTDERLAELDARYHCPLKEILSKNQYTRLEFDDLARRYGLMPAALVDAVNCWSDEFLGDFLIEEGDVYSVNTSLMGGEQ